MATVAPSTVTLSSPYLGKSSPSASIYQHGLPLPIYCFIWCSAWRFAKTGRWWLTSCDWNINQSFELHSTSSLPIGVYFHLNYGNEQIRALIVDALPSELKNTTILDIASIHLLSITHVNDHGQGPILLAIQLKSFDDNAQLFLQRAICSLAALSL